jgi:hypothetical protein
MSSQAPGPAGTGGDFADIDRILPCGRHSAALLMQVADGRTADVDLAAHTQTCSHCRAELGVLSEHWRLVRLAAEASTPTPPGLVSKVLSLLDGLRGRPHAEPVKLAQERGWLWVTERTVILLARQLATDLAAEHDVARIGAVTVDDDGLHVHLSLRYGVPAAAVAAAIRERLTAGLAEHLGPAVPAVNVIIGDVYRRPFG